MVLVELRELTVTPKPPPYMLRAVLCALYSYCGSSTKCHVPPEAVAHRLPREARGVAYKALRRLVSMGLVWEKSHGPRRSYGLTKEGVRQARETCSENTS